MIAFTCIALAACIFISGCTSGIAGTYTCTEDPDNSFVLNSDGTMMFKNSAGSFTGTYTFEDNILSITGTDSDGSTTTLSAPMESDGSFSFGLLTYRK